VLDTKANIAPKVKGLESLPTKAEKD